MKVFEKIYFGGGCFWCTEAAFKKMDGVSQVTPGYAGGSSKDPTYRAVCSGKTGHAEVVEVIFDNQIVSLNKMLDVFFAVHDPTTKNKQGADVGSQYRSIILYTSDKQKKSIDSFIKEEQKRYEVPIITEVKRFETFYPAEDYHHDYFKRNPIHPYCMLIIRPKMKKLDEHLRQKS